MKPKLFIWGAGGHAAVVAGIVQLADEYELVGLVDDINPERAGSKVGGETVLGGREQLDRLRDAGVEYAIIGFGNNPARLRLADLVVREGFCLGRAVHPRAIIAADVTIGEGSVVKGGAMLDPLVTIGANTIITPGFYGHGCTVGDGVIISGGSILAGDVSVGRGTRIGTGTTVIDRVRIGNECVIGAGSLVLEDVADGMVAYDRPAVATRRATPDDF